jgi:hypothetical protein
MVKIQRLFLEELNMKNGITIGSKNYTQIKVKVERIVHK